MNRALIVGAILLGIAARIALIAVAPRHGFLGDHVDYVCWGKQARTRGVSDLYRTPPPPCPAVVYSVDRPPQVMRSGTGQRLNYPPLAAYVFALQGRALAALDPSETANTFTSRAVYALSTTVGETIAALGTAALVRLFAGPGPAAWAFAFTFLAPPLLLDGSFWGQTEAWVLAPVVWMVWAMALERWSLAGILFGIALALKPSGLLFGPLWAYALLFRPARGRIIGGGVTALVVLNVLALPFWVTSGAAWLETSFLKNYVYDYHWTTMLTFNVWYADLLVTERLDSRAPLLGLAKDTWGTLLLLVGLALAFLLVRRWEQRVRHERARLGVLPLAALVTIAAVTLPTRTHGTYTAFMTPFLVGTAFLIPSTAAGAAALIVGASLQILSWQWGNLLAVHVLPNEQAFPAERYAARRALRARDRPREWALTILHLGAAVAVFGAVARTRRDRTRPD